MTRPLARDDVPTAARILARAMEEDPGWIHVFPDHATRAARMTRLFELVVGRHLVGLGTSSIIDDDAAAIWAPPGRRDMPLRMLLPLVPRLAWLVGRRVPAALRMFRAVERHAPREPHYYLAMLGVDPSQQGRGLGVAVVRPVLERCDAERMLAWLESANPKNHSFYHRLGFEAAAEQTFGDGPTLTWFARQPR